MGVWVFTSTIAHTGVCMRALRKSEACSVDILVSLCIDLFSFTRRNAADLIAAVPVVEIGA